MGCIPPIPDPATGALTCPEGYYFDTTSGQCCPVSTAPVDMQDPTIKKLVLGLPEATFDPAQNARLSAEGFKDSGLIERFIVGLLEIPLKVMRPVVEIAASLLDDSLAVLAEIFNAAQGEHSTGFYRLAAALMQDMLNIEVDPESLVNSFQQGGRVEAMRALGGKVVNTLASEFMGVHQTAANGTFSAAPGTGIAGLPAIDLSPQQGLDGLKAFVGFMTAFAIREGNTDFLASFIPHGYGEMFKDFAEDFAKNLGIGRLARMAWAPIVKTAVGVPVQWAMNEQYRPTLFDVGQAYRAWAAGALSSDALTAELRRHGWSDARQMGLQWQHLKPLARAENRLLHLVVPEFAQDYSVWEGRDGRTPEVTALLDQYDDLLPARAAVLKAADHFASQYLLGRITSTQYHTAILSVEKNPLGVKYLTDGEVAAFQSLEGLSVAGTRAHLTIARLMRDYEDGLLTLGEFEQRVTDMGYSPDDVTLLVQELLIASKRAADRAGKAAAAAARGPLAKLTVAQLETGYTSGLLDLATIAQELTARHYTAEAIAALEAEFRIKAGLQPKQPPTT